MDIWKGAVYFAVWFMLLTQDKENYTEKKPKPF